MEPDEKIIQFPTRKARTPITDGTPYEPLPAEESPFLSKDAVDLFRNPRRCYFPYCKHLAQRWTNGSHGAGTRPVCNEHSRS